MKKLFLALPCLLVFACSTATPPPAAPATPPAAAGTAELHGLTDEQEATILRLEDRREFDRSVAEAWAANSNVLHRARIALALGRIGVVTFDDANGNGLQDESETMAGVDILSRLAADSSVEVRRNVAFALGEIGDPGSIEVLKTLARNAEHADIAAEAVEALSKIAPSFAINDYLEFTGEELPEAVRARAVRYLFRFNSDEASSAAVKALDSSSLPVRREAAYALSRRPFPAANSRVASLLDDGDALIRSFAARALGNAGDAAVMQTLVTAVGDSHPWVRTNAARAIAQVAARDASSFSKISIPDAALRIVNVADDPDPGTRAAAIEALAAIAPKSNVAREKLLDLAVNGRAVQRETAVQMIARDLSDAAGSPLDALLQSDSRWIAIRAIEGSAARRAGAALRKRFIASKDASVRAAAVGAIPNDTIAAELEIVRTALNDDDPVVRANAIEKIASSALTPIEKRDLLTAAELRARTDTNNGARVSAIQALAAIDDPARRTLLESFIKDNDPVVRRVAAEALAPLIAAKRVQFTPLPIDRPIADYVRIAEWERGEHTASLKLTRGSIDFVLLSRDAPMTTWNFAQLASKGYFDGMTFMRVVPNFVVQAGDPRNDMSGDPGYSIRDEINPQKYTRGAVGMALSGIDTGGSQFFITHSPQPHLDGGYTVFGRVVHGMSGVVDQIERGDRVEKVTIDTAGQIESEAMAAVQKTPLPTAVGEMTAAQLVARLPEYLERKDAYAPPADVVEVIASLVRPDDRVIVYLGTWCPDSQREVPKMIRMVELLEANHGVKLPVQYIAIDRSKKLPLDLMKNVEIERVATFVYVRGDSELGRIVETPQAAFEDDLLVIVGKQ